MLKNMVSKYSPINYALLSTKILAGIAVIVGILNIKYGVGDFIAFAAFIISVMAIIFSVAIPVEEAIRRNIEKRLECLYKPIAQIIESPVNIENNFDNIISQFKEIRQYDHLAKDETTKGLFQQLTGTTTTSKPNMICKMKNLLEHVKKT